MKLSTSLKAVFLVLCVFVITLCFFFLDDSAGFCKAQNRTIPKEEFYIRALSSDFEQGFIKKDISDITVHDYIKNNPNCCVIEYNSYRDSRRPFDSYYKTIVTEYQLTDTGKQAEIKKNPHLASSSNEYNHLRVEMDIDNCGNILDWGWFTNQRVYRVLISDSLKMRRQNDEIV